MFALLNVPITHMLVEQLFFYYLALNHTLKIPLKFQHEVVNGFTFLRCVPKVLSVSVTI